MDYGSITIDFEALRKNKINITEMIIVSSTVINRRDRLENLNVTDRWDLLKAMERNIFQQEMKFLILFLREKFAGRDSLDHEYISYYKKQFLIKDKDQTECLLNSQEVHLSLNTIKE